MNKLYISLLGVLFFTACKVTKYQGEGINSTVCVVNLKFFNLRDIFVAYFEVGNRNIWPA